MEDTGTFRGAFGALCRLKRARSLMHALMDALQTDLAKLEVDILPASRAHGIAVLPQEVLHLIMEAIAHSTDDRELDCTAMTLAHVSSAFRFDTGQLDII